MSDEQLAEHPYAFNLRFAIKNNPNKDTETVSLSSTEIEVIARELDVMNTRMGERQTRIDELTKERDELRAVVEKFVEALNEITPHEWNNGCGCCSTESLEDLTEWRTLAALAATQNGGEG